MLVIRNQNELKNQQKAINNEKLYASLSIDADVLEEYPSQSEEYGPLIIMINDGEQNEMEDKYPIIKQLEPEDYLTIYEDEEKLIERTCYVLNDEGFIVYIVRKKNR